MAKYTYYLAKSKAAVDNPALPMAIHLRIRLIVDTDRSNPPFREFDDLSPKQVDVITTSAGGQKIQTVHVWLKETSTLPSPSLVSKDYIFEENNPLEHDNIQGYIIVHLRKLDGTSVDLDPTGNDDLVVDDMPIEYPVDDFSPVN